jgi:hypothetical protein
MTQIYTAALVGKKASVVDELLLLNPLVIPFLSLLGGFGTPVRNTQHEWNEDKMFPFKTTLNGDINDSVTTVNVAAGTGSIFRAGHVIQIDSELMLVESILIDALTVTRGYAGSTEAAHTSAAVIEINFTEGAEGAVARVARSKVRVNKYNYTQIIDDTISVSGSAVEVAQYGFDNLYEYEKQKKLVELAYQLEKACINGIRYQAGNIRQLGGLKYWITTNVTNASAKDITKTMLNDMVQAVADKAGLVGNYVFMASPTQKRKLGVLDASSLLIGREDRGRGETVKTILTDLGEFPVVTNPNLKPDDLIFTDISRIKVRPLGDRSFFHEYLGKVGDSYNGQIVGEYTLEFKEEEAHSRLVNLKTTF